MKYISILFFVSELLVFAGCNFREKKDNSKISDNSWSTLVIVSEHRTIITILNGGDTSVVETRHIGSIFTKRPKKVLKDTIKVNFTETERDSLFNLSKEIVLHPVLNTRHCTDFVGDLDIYIYYGNDISQTISYSNVCDWNTLSDKTLKLHDLLKKKMAKTFLGEGGSATSHVEN
ncbi:MAG: hypothetical protein JWQ57_1531 [Mucilaginibacter sp.]|nr:hypothetical protein [Mucilaginibacter sp.]